MKKEIKNISFQNGIVENFKQDYFTQQEQFEYALTSALYLENYNPNIEYHSLVIRPGLNILKSYNDDHNLFNGVPFNNSGIHNTKNTFNNNKWLEIQHYMRMNYTDSKTPYNKLDALFLSYYIETTHLPEYHKRITSDPMVTAINFHAVDVGDYLLWQPNVSYSTGVIRSYEAINYICIQDHTSSDTFSNAYWDIYTDVENWQLSYDATNKQGFLSLGKFRDAVRNGSSFLYVTEPMNRKDPETPIDPLDPTPPSELGWLYFPVYVFQQIKDPRTIFRKALKEKTYDYLNGLTFKELDDEFWKKVALRQFRTKYPSGAFFDTSIIKTSIRYQKTLRTDESHIKQVIKDEVNGAVGDGSWFTGIDWDEAAFVISEEKRLLADQQIYDIGLNVTPNESFLASDSFNTVNDTHLDIPRIELLVWEQPLLFRTSVPVDLGFISEEKRMAYTFNPSHSKNTWSVKAMQQRKKTDDKIYNNLYYKFPYVETFLKPNHNTVTNALRYLTTWEDVTLVLNNETYKFWSIGKAIEGSRTYHLAARFVAHDYIKVDIPRCWMSGDKIPFLVTANLNGQEVVLLKETYSVGQNFINDLALMRKAEGTVNIGTNIHIFNNQLSHNINDQYLNTDTLDNITDDIEKAPRYTSNIFRNYLKNIDPRFASMYDNADKLQKVNGTLENNVGVAPVDSMTLYDRYNDPSEFAGYLNNYHTTDLSGLHNTIQFTIRLNKDALAILLAQGCSDIKVYASRPNNDEKLFDKVGSSSLIDSPDIYAKPLIDSNSDDKIIEGNKYGLLKTFVMSGKSDIIEDYYDVKTSNKRTNAWRQEGDSDWIYAIPVDEGTRKAGLRKEITDNVESDAGDLYIPELQFKSVDHNETDPNVKYYNNYTPDFFLWDYPSDSPSYIISNSGQYYKGTGARCITSVKGRTFIGGCFDKDYIEEQAIVRYSSINNGANIVDLFAEEEKIQIGHLPITSLVEYREQLWVFNLNNYYRIALNEIANPASWEFLDSKFGQGTFSPKTVCKTPYGVCFSAFGGIYLSDGTNPVNLVDNPQQVLAIKSLYQHLMLGNTYEYSHIFEPGSIFIEEGDDYNRYAELFYSEEKDELILTTPIKKEIDDIEFSLDEDDRDHYNDDSHLQSTHWLKLIYSFSNKNWRTESGEYYYEDEPPLNKAITYAENGRMWEQDRVARPTINVDNTLDKDSRNTNNIVAIYKEDVEKDQDLIQGSLIANNKNIWGKVLTHEIGDGENDAMLNKAIVECSPKEVSSVPELDWRQLVYNSSTTARDPYFAYELRNRTWHNQSVKFNEIDLISGNLTAKGGQNIFMSRMTTPANDNDANYTIDGTANLVPTGAWVTGTAYVLLNTVIHNGRSYVCISAHTSGTFATDLASNLWTLTTNEQMVARESLNLIAPMSKFRRTRFTLVSKIIAKVRTIMISYKVFNRRNY